MTKEIEELKEIMKGMEQTIEKLQAQVMKRNKMIEDFKDLIGKDNFDTVLNLQGYSMKK